MQSRAHRLAAILFAFSTFAQVPANACRFERPAAADAVARHALVFIAHVDEVQPATPLRYDARERTATLEQIYAKATGRVTDVAAPWVFGSAAPILGTDRDAFVRASVTRAVKGDAPDRVLLLNDVRWCFQGSRFNPGTDYLIFAEIDPGGGYLRATRESRELSSVADWLAIAGVDPRTDADANAAP